MPNYDFYHTMHPDGTAHGGSGILIRSNIRHYVTNPYCKEEIQATNIVVQDWSNPITIAAIYSPPKHKITKEQYSSFFRTLGHTFIAGGDYNAKHVMWGSRLTNTKGRQLQSALSILNLKTISSGQPTYWPTDPDKIPDLIDFCVVKGIKAESISCEPCWDLSSDHSPVKVTLSRNIVMRPPSCVLHSKHTNWDQFKCLVSNSLDTRIPLKTEDDLTEAVEHFNRCIQSAAWSSTPALRNGDTNKFVPLNIREKLAEKRRLRKVWQQTRHPFDKAALNKATKDLKLLLSSDRNNKMNTYLLNLDTTKDTNYSLWKATKDFNKTIQHKPPIRKPDRTWTKGDSDIAETFAVHLKDIFVPNNYQGSPESLDSVLHALSEPYQLDLPIEKFTVDEVKSAIHKQKDKKAPGYDLITAKVLKELPEEGFRLLTFIYNAILINLFVPPQWKVSQIKMIAKPGKPTEDPKSYRPISLLPIPSKIMEILFLSRFNPVVESNNLIPEHQFGFRKKHGTIEQVHRLVERIHAAFEKKEYCPAVFLDISQAFDRVWHEGLLYKLKTKVPVNFFLFIKAYLENRHFFVKQGDEISSLCRINAGVPQGSILGPLLYLIYTADLPTTEDTLVGTFADDTAVVASDNNPIQASRILQTELDNITRWLHQWRIKPNESKSVQVTFTLRKGTCPCVTMNNTPIPQSTDARYLGIHLDDKLIWRKHIFTKRLAAGLKLRSLNWMLNRKSKLSLENKIIIYKCILKPIWSYGIQLWGTAANSNLEILQRFQTKVLRQIANAPQYISINQIHRELQIPLVKDEIRNNANRYKSRIQQHPNQLASNLMGNSSTFSRLKRRAPLDLAC